MKRTLSLVFALILMISALSCAFAADVSGYEAHATIDLTPFKTTNYDGTFDSISYTATIKSKDMIKLTISRSYGSDTRFEFTPEITLDTLYGVEMFTPRLSFYTNNYTSIGGFYFVNGENRYLVSLINDHNGLGGGLYGYISIGTNMFNILKEIANSTYSVQIALAGSTSVRATLTEQDKQLIKTFVTHIESSGLSQQLTDDSSSIITITQFN